MTVRTPPGVLNTESTDSSVQRDVHRSLLGGQLTSFAGGVGAVNGAAHGVCGAGHLAVSQSGTPAMSVDVAAGSAFITGTASALQGPYNMVNDASVTLAIAAADATNPRRDLVIAQIRDDTYDGSGFRDARLTVVTGTPAASPSDPSLSAHPNALVLARVEVAALASTITNANITDLREPAGYHELDARIDALEALGVWTAFTPSWSGLTVGNGAQSGEYMYLPGEMRVRATLTLGSTSSVTGPVGLTLPNGETIRAAARESFRTFGDVTFRDTGSATHIGVVQYLGSASVAMNRQVVSGSKVTATTVSSTTPFTWTTGDILLADFTVPI